MSEHLTQLEKMRENLEIHSRSDEEFQVEMRNMMLNLTTKVDEHIRTMNQWTDLAKSFSITGKFMLRTFGYIVAITAGIAAIKYLASGILHSLLK